ncbi:MAG: 16S rRNA (uracil(1498)-N(3))-methyltransferase [Burkholderiaceae bacterium]
MAAARFFIDAPLATGAAIVLPKPVAHHATRVLRLRDGASIVLFNGSGGEFAATLSTDDGKTQALVGTHESIERESPLDVTLIQSWIGNDKLDWVVEKAVELGVGSIVLAPAQRSVNRPSAARSSARLERLRSIIISACAQCGRNRIPVIDSSPSWIDALQEGLRRSSAGLLFHPDATSSLRDGSLPLRVAVAIGPEGGFDGDEVALALRLGYVSFRLGARVLRTETAGLAALAALQTVRGDLG